MYKIINSNGVLGVIYEIVLRKLIIVLTLRKVHIINFVFNIKLIRLEKESLFPSKNIQCQQTRNSDKLPFTTGYIYRQS